MIANENSPLKHELRGQRLINLEIPFHIQSLKSSNIELGLYLDGRLFKCCLSVAANPESRLDLISRVLYWLLALS